MAVFPMFIELENKICLIIGGGKVALRKAVTLLDLGALVHVFSLDFDLEFQNLEADGRVICHKVKADGLESSLWLEAYVKSVDLNSIAMLICATSHPEVNHRMALWGKQQKIPVSSATSSEDCDFFFPSVVRRGKMTVGISTGGRTPALARLAREQIQAVFPEWYDRLEELGAYARVQIHRFIKDVSERKALLNRILKVALEAKGHMTESDVDTMIEEYRTGNRD